MNSFLEYYTYKPVAFQISIDTMLMKIRFQITEGYRSHSLLPIVVVLMQIPQNKNGLAAVTLRVFELIFTITATLIALLATPCNCVRRSSWPSGKGPPPPRAREVIGNPISCGPMA